jgi:uncharacterized lipoprotein YddW (UPF0748 family)
MKQVAVVLWLACLLLPTLCPSGGADGAGAETRAVWVTRWAFKEPGEVRRLFADLAEMGINTVFFQVRGSCDALYRSPLEPWSDLLAGRLGADPGWDPLALALEEGHSRGMEVHAWINVFTAWAVSEAGTPPPISDPLHVFNAHPEWLASDATGRRMSLVRAENEHNYAFLSPTHEGVQDHIAAVVRDLVRNYDIDGLHLDYVRFPDSSYSYDPDSRAAYRLDMMLKNAGEESLTYREWRIRDLDEFVGRLARTARTVRPSIKVSAAVWQKMDAGREVYLQDGLQWIRQGHLDFLVPMIYTPSPEAFEERLAAYAGPVGAGRIVAGLGPYLESFTDSILAAELDLVKTHGVKGYAIFNSDYALKYRDILRGNSSQ